MKYLINFSGGNAFKDSQKNNALSGLQNGFDAVIQYGPRDIDSVFYNNNRKILKEKRGAGYWLWKPYFILETLNRVKKDDIVFYADAGSTFIRNMDPIFELIKEKGLLGFKMSGGHKEHQYTRRKVVKYFYNDEKEVCDTNQDMASFIGVRKGANHLPLVEWLIACQKPELIMDCARDPHEFAAFIDHRHDQSLWSLISKMHGVHKAPDPTQWGANSGESSVDDLFINHHRDRS